GPGHGPVALRPLLPGGLRDRAVPPGAPDPLRRPQPPPRGGGRARLRPLARPGGAAARARAPAALARDPPPARRLPRAPPQPPVRAHLHESPHHARAGPRPAARRRARPRTSAR